jgi:branched-chain amino acid aminotransferase
MQIPVGPAGLGTFANVIQREILGRQIGEIPSDWAVVL